MTTPPNEMRRLLIIADVSCQLRRAIARGWPARDHLEAFVRSMRDGREGRWPPGVGEYQWVCAAWPSKTIVAVS